MPTYTSTKKNTRPEKLSFNFFEIDI